MQPKSSDEDPESPTSSSLYIQLPGQRRRAIAELGQILNSPRPSKRPRRTMKDAQETREEVMEVTPIDSEEEELGDDQDLDPTNCFISHNTPTRTNAGTRRSSSSVGEEELISLINVNNPSKANEDVLQDNIRCTTREGKRTSAGTPQNVGSGSESTHSSLKQTATQPGGALTNGDAGVPWGMSLTTEILKDEGSIWPGAKVRICSMA
ncbi:hypothetical protein J3R83DRAFT_7804 [Lanmaoa asiatica]|nr:hypothetical protein J3R83DRAFT_7804 [Lanmaoa asiatica]